MENKTWTIDGRAGIVGDAWERPVSVGERNIRKGSDDRNSLQPADPSTT
jgi:hypothetical protein